MYNASLQEYQIDLPNVDKASLLQRVQNAPDVQINPELKQMLTADLISENVFIHTFMKF